MPGVEFALQAKRRQLREHGQFLLSPNDLANIQSQSEYEVVQERNELRHIDRILVKNEKRGKKKKGKGVEEYEYSLKPNVHLRVNYDRYGVLMRDELIIKAAEDRWNKSAAEVVRAVLAASLDEDSVLAEGRTHKDVGVNEIVQVIPQSSYPLLVAGMVPASSKSVPELVREYLSILAGEDQMIGNGGAFLKRDGSTNPSYVVELESICKRLKATLLTELVRDRLGDRAARVLAVVAKASKAGETTV